MPVKLVKMKAKKSLRYGTRMMQAGDEFDARGETDARLYEALGYAEKLVTMPETPKPAPVVAAPPVKRTYTRRAPISFVREFAEPTETKPEDPEA